MGNTQAKSNVLQQYQILQRIGPLRKILKHKTDNTTCLLVSFPIYGQQKYNLIERVKARLANDKPQLVTPLVSWYRNDQANLCGNRQSIELIFQQTSPTLQSILQSRRQKNICFTASEILYVVKNIALALKSLQKIHQEYGKVNLSNIAISNDVLLMDSLTFEKKVGMEYKKQEIEGYPSPQKLRSLYDSVSNFEQLRGDLFSLGMVALQLYFPSVDSKSLYLISDPRYSNYRLNLQKLYQMCNQVRQPQLRQAFAILLNLNSKDRLNIYTFLKTVAIDMAQVRFFEQSTPIEVYTPKLSTVDRPAIQMVTSQNNTVSASIKRQDYPVSTVESTLSLQKQGSQIRNINVPPINFRPPVLQNNAIYQNPAPLQTLPLRNQPSTLANGPISFQPLRFVLQDNFETSQYVNVTNSVHKQMASSTIPFNQTPNRIIFPFSQILASAQKNKAENQPNINTQIKYLNFTVNGSAAKQQSKHLNAQIQNVQRDQVRVTPNQKENFSMPKRTESIYQQETRPVAQQLFKGIIIETSQRKQKTPSPSKQSLQIEINTIPISNTYNPTESKTDQQSHQEMSLTPTFSEIQLAQAIEQNITETVTTSIQNNQQEAPNPEDKIEFVIEQYGVGTRYEGGKLNGMRHGRGKFYYKEGSYYDGEWKNNKMHGIGVLYYPNGTIAYEGEWKNDQFDGRGIVYNDQQVKLQGTFDFTDFNKLDEQWVKYEGDLKNDAKQGLGRLYLTNGQIYEGQFSKDTVYGVGVFKSGKSQKRGIWQNGKLKKLI